MDHSNIGSKKCPHKMCTHGNCLDHGPEWENIGEKQNEPHSGIFAKKTYWTRFHCGKPMARYKVVQTKRCRKCGRTKNETMLEELALCLCCGYHFDNTLQPGVY